MLKNKLIRIIMILSLAAVSGVVFSTGCFKDDNTSRISINLVRNDLIAKPEIRKKHLIDSILEFFSSRAEAGGWSDDRNNLKLTVTGDSYTTLEFAIPDGATSYTTSIPAGEGLTLTITGDTDTMGYGIQNVWGGHTTVDLLPGEDHDVSIEMIPMTWITGASGSASLTVNWYYISVTSYNLYRSTKIDGPYTKILSNSGSLSYTDNSVTTGLTYYYRVSANNSKGEGVMSNPVLGVWVL